MVHGHPGWVCDICSYDLPPVGGEALYNRPSGTRHYPTPVIVCGKGCAAVAETRLMAGEVERVPWARFLQALMPAAV
jgi:hypothetical protein